jgi:uncharacterized repeat protein (TIGR03803 family)
MRRNTTILSIVLFTFLLPPAERHASRGISASTQPQLIQAYGHLPLSFEANQGQTDQQVRFLARGRGYSLFLTGNEAVLTLKKSGRSVAPRADPAVLRMRLVGANAKANVAGLEELPGKSNYFIGNDPNKWRTNVPNYAKVKYESVYPGVDLVYYGNQGKLEYDFVVQPGADPRQIALDVGTGPRIDGNGDLVVGADGGEVTLQKPVLYQPARDHGQRTKNVVKGTYLLTGGRVAFEVGSYDKTRPLVIDPTLAYSTSLGGSFRTGGSGIAVDASGDAYVVGGTGSTDFPTTFGAFQTTFGGSDDVFVTKLNAAGSALIYSTYLGGSQTDYGYGIAIDASGNAYVTGETLSSNFPTTAGSFQTSCAGACAFVTKLNATGSALVSSTFLGGGLTIGKSIAIDASSNAYVTGETGSASFPTTLGAFQTNCTKCPFTLNAFVTELNAAGSALVYSTFLGGSTGGSAGDEGFGIAVDASGNAYVTGVAHSSDFPTTFGGAGTCAGNVPCPDAFVTKLNAAGTALLYSTFLGGANSDGGAGIALDASGNAYVTGNTLSSNFPTTSGVFQTILSGGGGDAFVSKLNAAGSALVYSTYLGGGFSGGSGIAVDSIGNAYVAGGADSNFPVTSDAFQTTRAGGYDAFLTKLSGDGVALLYSTLLGGSNNDSASGIAIDSSGNAYITGSAASVNFPTTSGAFQTTGAPSGDAFVAKFEFAAATGPFTVLANFDGSAGSLPEFVTLVQGLDGNLYGTASQGGSFSKGTVFQVTTTGRLAAIYNFDGSMHGAAPLAGLVLGTDGNFYGTTTQGGANGFGTIFQITPNGALTTLHNFNGTDGANAKGALVQSKNDGRFYGTTYQGGVYGFGTVFSISSGGQFTSVHAFQIIPYPMAGLVQANDGSLYGSTLIGGPDNCGAIFKIHAPGYFLAGSRFDVMHNFDCADGAQPEATLIQGNDRQFYGTTLAGGTGAGTIFHGGSGEVTMLSSFDGSTQGSMPAAPLIQATDGSLYGTASVGGSCGGGTVFKATSAGALTALHSLCGTDGNLLEGGLVEHTNGLLYGLAKGGGTNSLGTIFSMNVGLNPSVKTLPASAPVGAAVNILGTNLTGATSVRFGATSAIFNVVSSSQISTTVPTGATTGIVQVVTPSATLTGRFGVTPSITGFSPPSGSVVTSVIIMGGSFNGATNVIFGNVNATSFHVNSNTQITAIVPSGAMTGRIGVTTPGGTTASSGIFTVQ